MAATVPAPDMGAEDDSGLFGSSPTVVNLLDVEPDLADAVAPEHQRAFALALRAERLSVQKSESLPHADRDGIGLLIASGMVARIVRVGRRESLELLGPGDLVQPGRDEDSTLMDCEVVWQALEPVTLANLDARFCRVIHPWPHVTAALASRGMRRARWLAVQGAIDAHPTVEERLMLLFCHLGERMGRMSPEGVVLELPLSHRLLAHAVRALRPSVTAGLLRLREDGRLLQRERRTWIVTPAGLEYAAGLCRQDAIDC